MTIGRFAMGTLLSMLSCDFSSTDLEAQILMRTVLTRFMDYRCDLEQNFNMPLAFQRGWPSPALHPDPRAARQWAVPRAVNCGLALCQLSQQSKPTHLTGVYSLTRCAKTGICCKREQMTCPSWFWRALTQTAPCWCQTLSSLLISNIFLQGIYDSSNIFTSKLSTFLLSWAKYKHGSLIWAN